MNRLDITASILFVAATCFAKSNALENKYRALADGPVARGAQWGVYIADAKTGKAVLEHYQDNRFIPASTLKLFVTAAAMSGLGPDYRFKTEVCTTAPVNKGTLSGDLAVIGAGDPSLGSTVIEGAQPYDEIIDGWAQAVAKAGITEITGDIVADVSLFDGLSVPRSWPYEDLGNYYAAPASALSIHDNLYKLIFKTGKQSGDPVRILRTEPEMEGLAFTNYLFTGTPGSGDEGYIFRAPGQTAAQLRGTEGPSSGEAAIKGSMPDPALFTVRELTKALVRHGIKVAGNPRVSQTPANRVTLIAQTSGSTVKDIVFETNKRSFNFYAEMLLRALAVQSGHKGTETEGIAQLRAFLERAGVNTTDVRLDDACGLSKNDLVTPHALAQILVYARKSQSAADFENSLPVPGDKYTTGHIKHFGAGTPVAERVKLKSGSLSDVRSYAGYLKAKSGKTLVFAFIINGYNASGDEVDKLHEQLLNAAYSSQ
jgi:D-alanyl-D-alanine carboxypeptidase/D-alanyl-D-alanine-endopeptidase (penicillin-binding protein 4)